MYSVQTRLSSLSCVRCASRSVTTSVCSWTWLVRLQSFPWWTFEPYAKVPNRLMQGFRCCGGCRAAIGYVLVATRAFRFLEATAICIFGKLVALACAPMRVGTRAGFLRRWNYFCGNGIITNPHVSHDCICDCSKMATNSWRLVQCSTSTGFVGNVSPRILEQSVLVAHLVYRMLGLSSVDVQLQDALVLETVTIIASSCSRGPWSFSAVVICSFWSSGVVVDEDGFTNLKASACRFSSRGSCVRLPEVAFLVVTGVVELVCGACAPEVCLFMLWLVPTVVACCAVNLDICVGNGLSSCQQTLVDVSFITSVSRRLLFQLDQPCIFERLASVFVCLCCACVCVCIMSICMLWFCGLMPFATFDSLMFVLLRAHLCG